MVIAAEQYACRLVVPSSQQFGAKRWPSHKDHAAKALQKLAGPHLPATLRQLEKAITRARADLHDAQEQAHAKSQERAVAARNPGSVGPDAGAVDEPGESVETSDEQHEDNDPVDGAAELGSSGHVFSDADPGL